ncbi:uncharacterized protein DUF3830 [Ciceribacter lividus]|uniref:Uncharacterized protein DUF3830 n=1 Tax=Ciceribacter lividus TaxID=1197950 RepID=A0A6I7HS77_9HYPH|nr:DUF3830 family protein [Ciceribacter lividus]RCW27592.1 uncharacterized protein DUF3830 [Ciceribacter lividus]
MSGTPAELLKVTVGPFVFVARFELEKAPETCRIFKSFLPFRNQTIHSRWSGEAVWVPLGNFAFGAGFENHTSHPSRGDILLYPGGFSETELLFAYGSSQFASKMGVLAGNHFLTIVEGREHLEAMGRMVLWQGAQAIVFEAFSA